jgi:prevent-host-death family protein
MNNIISALNARVQLGQILKRASEGGERFMVDRRGKPSVIIMGIKDFIKNIAPTPEAYQEIRDEAKRNGTSLMSMAEIDREVAEVRRLKRERTLKQMGA